MKVTTKSTSLRPGKPSRRALIAYYGVGLTLGLIVAGVARIVWDRSTMVMAGFIFTAVYVLVALPILFWGATRPSD